MTRRLASKFLTSRKLLLPQVGFKEGEQQTDFFILEAGVGCGGSHAAWDA